MWLFTSIALLGFVVQGTLANWTQEHRVLASYFLYPSEWLPVLGVSWTIVHELYFYVVFAVLLLLPAAILPYGLALWGSTILVGESQGWEGKRATNAEDNPVVTPLTRPPRKIPCPTSEPRKVRSTVNSG